MPSLSSTRTRGTVAIGARVQYVAPLDGRRGRTGVIVANVADVKKPIHAEDEPRDHKDAERRQEVERVPLLLLETANQRACCTKTLPRSLRRTSSTWTWSSPRGTAQLSLGCLDQLVERCMTEARALPFREPFRCAELSSIKRELTGWRTGAHIARRRQACAEELREDDCVTGYQGASRP